MTQKGVAGRAHRPNFALLFIIVMLIAAGTIIISSASVVLAKQLNGDPNYFLKQHLISLIGGFSLMYLGYRLDYRIWKKFAPILILGGLILMIAIFIPGIGFSSGGARRWIKFPFFFAPTELFKLTLIIYLASWFEKKGAQVKSLFFSTIPFVAILALSIGLVMMQPDMGTTMVIISVAGIMYFIAGANWTHIMAMLGAGVAGFIAMIKLSPYRMARFTIFLDPSSDPNGKGYQINQALLAIGTGGLFGLGFGQSRQKFNYLPEPATDAIFAVTAEELGFVRAGLLVLVFVLLAVQGYRVAQKAPDNFARLLAAGITTWICVQAFINIAAMLSLIPLTGVPLPFISYGSSSTVILMLASGILLNISRHTEGETRESRSQWGRNWWTYLTGFSRN